ncbi:hypothetical protein Zmor_000864 [Zophobas morio]|uniref:Uncharacterized protein n=1 Tax=Zophobas morio TaxID=2755281 RepID=A0AA38J5R3_9CUCU|nr:hypothetical protein Zmor_000864 [Zophobas morio]
MVSTLLARRTSWEVLHWPSQSDHLPILINIHDNPQPPATHTTTKKLWKTTSINWESFNDKVTIARFDTEDFQNSTIPLQKAIEKTLEQIVPQRKNPPNSKFPPNPP